MFLAKGTPPMNLFPSDQWALILGASSGFGLATAKKLASQGLSVCLVHRDRRGAMDRIEPEFETIKAYGHGFLAFNLDALSADGIAEAINGLKAAGGTGKLRVLLHSIAFGNLKFDITNHVALRTILTRVVRRVSIKRGSELAKP